MVFFEEKSAIYSSKFYHHTLKYCLHLHINCSNALYLDNRAFPYLHHRSNLGEVVDLKNPPLCLSCPPIDSLSCSKSNRLRPSTEKGGPLRSPDLAA